VLSRVIADPEEVAKTIAAVSASLVLLGQALTAGGVATAISTDRATLQAAVASVVLEAQKVTAALAVQLRR
jgi:hypothetical protein